MQPRPPDPQDHRPPAGYAPVTPLGRGATATVYRATTPAGELVALKVLATDASPAAAWAFEQEFQRLARLDHRAFPRARKQGRTEAGAPYYEMGLVPHALDSAAPWPADRVRAALADLAAALAHMHARGLIHGDLKPENLGVDEAGRLCVLDLGFAAPIGERPLEARGTPAFMAPEVWRLAQAHPAADWYALGVLAHRLWTGRPPFPAAPGTSATLGEVMRAHLEAPPPPPTGAPDEDPALARAIAAMLEKDPGRRLADGRTLRRALELPDDGEPLPPPGAWLWDPGLVGRADALAAWRATLAAGHGALHLVGPAGAGHTRMLAAMRAEAAMAGWTPVGAACIGPEEPAAGPLRTLVANALRAAGLTPGAEEAVWLAGGTPAAFQDLEPQAREVALARALQAAIARAAEAVGGLALLLDDAALAERATRKALEAWACQPAGARVAWALAGLREPPVGGGIALVDLPDEAIAAVVERRLGAPPPGALLADLLPAAGGRPGLASRLLDELVATGALSGAQGAWRYARQAASRGTTGADAWRGRVGALSAPARRIGAVLGLTFPATIGPEGLATLPDLPPADLVAGLGELLGAGLVVREPGGGVRLAIAGAGPALLAASPTSPADGRAVAAALLGLAGTQAPPPAWSAAATDAPLTALDRAATLLREAAGSDAGDDVTVGVGLAAAARMLAAGTPAAALAHAEALADRPAAAPTAWILAADASRWLDRPEAALAWYERAIAAAPGPVPEWRVGMAKCLQLRGRLPEATAALDAAVAEATAGGQHEGGTLVRALVARARLARYAGRLDAAAADADRATAVARDTRRPALLARALNFRGALAIERDPARASEGLGELAEALALAEGLGDDLTAVHVLENLGNAQLALGDMPAAADAFERQEGLCERIGVPTEALGASVNRAIVADERGDAREALAIASDVVERAARAGRRFLQAVASAVVARSEARLGAPEPGLEAPLRLAKEVGSPYLEGFVRLRRLDAWLDRDDLEAARAEFAACREVLGDGASPDDLARLQVAAVRLATAEPDASQARALDALAEGSNPVHRRRARLARAAWPGRAPAAARLDAEAALAEAQAWGGPFTVAEAWLALARLAAAGAPAEMAIGEAVAALRAGGADEAAIAARLSAVGLAAPSPAARPAGGEAPGTPLQGRAFAEALSLAEDETAIARVALRAMRESIGAERGYVLIYEAGRLARVVSTDAPGGGVPDDAFSRTVAEHVLWHGEPLHLADAATDPAWREVESVAALAVRTVVALPLSTPATVFGVVYLERAALEPAIGPATLDALAAAAVHAAAAIARERRGRAAARQARTQGRLAAVGAALARRGLDAAREVVLEAALELVAGTRAWLLDAAPDARGWKAIAGVGRGADDDRPVPLAPGAAAVSQGVAAWVAERGEPLALWDAAGAEGWRERESIAAIGLQTVYCVPLPGTAALLYLEGRPQAPEADAVADDGLAALQALAAFGAPLLGLPALPASDDAAPD